MSTLIIAGAIIRFYDLLGKCYVASEQTEQGLEAFRVAMKLSSSGAPDAKLHRELFAEVTKCYYLLGKFEDAIELSEGVM